MREPNSLLRSATRRAKSDVANKLVSMFLHELSRKISKDWPLRVDGLEYQALALKRFSNKCPYCTIELSETTPVIEHLDGMNRYRVGLHVPGNVLVACKRCNSEKRRDDAAQNLSIGGSGWESFLSHNGARCPMRCSTCGYWAEIWRDESERKAQLSSNLARIRSFRAEFPEFERALPTLRATLPVLLAKLYTDCQAFAESEIKALLTAWEEEAATKAMEKSPPKE